MSERYVLLSEGIYDLAECSKHSTTESAEKAMCDLFDAGKYEDFRIFDSETKYSTIIRGYRLVKEACPICQKEVRVREMQRTFDYHGIPFRRVCYQCFDNLMDEKGYDGEPYTEDDECIDCGY